MVSRAEVVSPGTFTIVRRVNAAEWVFAYMTIVNRLTFHTIYGTQTVGGAAGYFASPRVGWRVYRQDNVTASYGVLGSNTYVVP
jgi:hypothetical protein